MSQFLKVIGAVVFCSGCAQSERVTCGQRVIDRRAALSAECRPVDEDSAVTLAVPNFSPTREIFDNVVVTGSAEDKLGRVVELLPWGPQNLKVLPERYWYRSILIARNGRVLSADRSLRAPGPGECAFRIMHEARESIVISARDADDRAHGYMVPLRRKTGILLECVCDGALP